MVTYWRKCSKRHGISLLVFSWSCNVCVIYYFAVQHTCMCISTMYNYMKQLVVVYIYIELYTLGVKYLNHIVEVILFIYCCFPPFSLFLPFIPLYNYLKNHQRIKVKSSCLLIIFIYSTYWGTFRPKLLINIFFFYN